MEMRTENVYHLDTSFSILNNETVVIQPAAFTEKDYKTLTQGFRNVINVDMQESLKQLAANCFCPNDKDVVVHQGTEKFKSAVARAGFNVHEVDTSEFLKSGGSVFCMKLALPK